MTRAQMLGCERRLATGLHLAHKLLGAPLPEGVRRRIAHSREVDYLAGNIAGALVRPGPNDMSAFRSLCLDLKLYESARQRFGHCMNTFFAPTLAEWSLWSLPRTIHFLYIPLRVIRLIRKYLLIMLNRQ